MKGWKRRVVRYIVILAVMGVFLLAVKGQYAHFEFPASLSMMLGLLAFIMIGVTLLIGPLQHWFPGKITGVLLRARRDIGILGGLAAIFHVLSSIHTFREGPRFFFLGDNSMEKAAEGWKGLFFYKAPEGVFIWNTGLVGIANYLSAIAFLFMIVLLLTSSDRAIRWLGTASWKRLHVSNLFIFILVAVHALIYIHNIKGHPDFNTILLVVAGGLLLFRMITFLKVARKKREGKYVSATKRE